MEHAVVSLAVLQLVRLTQRAVHTPKMSSRVDICRCAVYREEYLQDEEAASLPSVWVTLRLPLLSARNLCQSHRCAVCREEYLQDEEVAPLPCSHFYHPDCIAQWLQHQKVS